MMLYALIPLSLAFVGGYLVGRFHTKIGAYLARRAQANKLKAAQALVDEYEKAKALLAANTPTFPPKPTVTP